jgi:PLP dependent protein
MSNLTTRLAENLAEIRGRIADAAARSGRAADAVRLVAVTKYVASEQVRALVAAGCTKLGESRPQELWEKVEALADLPIQWHFIGHLQRNKVRRTLPQVMLIHSVDSARLMAAINDAAGDCPSFRNAPSGCRAKMGLPPSGTRFPILLEVNVSGEPAKHGFAPDEIEPLLPELAAYGNVEIRGLMCMAGLEGDPEAARRQFAALRTLRDRLQRSTPPEIRLDELSMGMSGDYEVAIEEGATIVRIGSALFA